MKIQALFTALFITTLSFVGCKNDTTEPTTPNEPDKPKPHFVIEVKSLTETTVEFSVTPADMEMTYIAMMTTKEYYDSFEDNAEAFVYDDIAWFYEISANEGITFEECLAERLKTGTLNDTQENLDPDSEYYIYAYGLSPEGDVLTPLYTTLFKTLSPELTKITFDVEVIDIDYTEATVNVTPSDNDALYFINVFSVADYEYYGGDDKAFANHLKALRSHYLNLGATTEQMVANLGAVGDKQLTAEKLSPGATYYAYAIGINEDFVANSAATFVMFDTVAAKVSDLTFEVAITDIYYDHIEGNITPSNSDETYICSVQTADVLDRYADDTSLMNAIISDIKYWGNIDASLHRGTMSLNAIAGLNPETEYIIICFGYEGAPTTAPQITPFTTAAATGNPEELIVTLEVVDITHNSATVITTPSSGAYYFTAFTTANEFRAKSVSLGSDDLAVAYFANDEIDYAAKWFGYSRAEYLYEIGAYIGEQSTPYAQLKPETEYVAYAIAVDIESGELASTKGYISEPFTTLEKVTSDALVTFHIDDYYDGTALAELDPQRFLNCKERAVVPYTITVNDTASEWYTAYFVEDYTSWECTDDDIYTMLITYGYESGVDDISVNRTSGVAVLPYDTAYSFLGMAKDAQGNYGHGTIKVVTCTRDGVAPAEEFINSLAIL